MPGALVVLGIVRWMVVECGDYCYSQIVAGKYLRQIHIASPTQDGSRQKSPRCCPGLFISCDGDRPDGVLTDRRGENLERPFRSGGNPQQGGAREAMRAGKRAARRARGVVAIGGNRPSARAEIEVRVRSVNGRRRSEIPGEVLAQLPFPRHSVHVCRVIVGSEGRRAWCRGAKLIGASVSGAHQGCGVVLARITLRAERMRPAEMQTIDVSYILAQESPRAVPRSFILEL
jgi:hypothetical protein